MPSFQYSKIYSNIEQTILTQCQQLGRDRLVAVLSHRKAKLLFLSRLIGSLENHGGSLAIKMELVHRTLTVDVILGIPDQRNTGHGRIFCWQLDQLFP